MRLLGLAIGLICAAINAAQALEIEDRRLFAGNGDRVLRIISTTDLGIFTPYIAAFQAAHPDVTVDYTMVSSTSLHGAIRDGLPFDLAMSSAMDLQLQLANDGFAQRYRSAATENLPDWARWRGLIFAFTSEAAVVVINKARFAGLPVPTTRQELITTLRDHPDRFSGAIGTYDVRSSGLGYLFATQEDRATDAYWRLNEVMGRLDPQLYCCSVDMIDDLAAGRLALAYNVLGSYALGRLATDPDPRIQIVQMQDFTNVMLRTAIIPANAADPAAAGDMIDMLATLALRASPGDWPLPSLSQTGDAGAVGFSPIRLGPALLVYLDPLNRRRFMSEWDNAMQQR